MESTVEKYKNQIFESIEKNRDELIDLSRYIWENPEIGYKEFKACKVLTDMLDKNGFEIELNAAGLETGFVARRGDSKDGPTIALLAEYDSLGGELGHACGHNIFSVSAVGAAISLADILEKIGGNVVVVGTPAEEGVVKNAGGKAIMVEKGIFDSIDAAIICHSENRTIVERELVAQQSKEVRFIGKSAHSGGAPHEGINALTAGMLTINNINALRQHFLPRIIVNPIITEGGYAQNTIPDKCTMKVSLRAPRKDMLTKLVDQVENCVKAAALVTGCEYEIENLTYMYENVVPNHSLSLVFKEALDILGIESIQSESANYAWDIGNVGNVVPIINPYIKIGDSSLVGHTAAYREASNSESAYEALIIGAKAMALTAANYLASEKIREDVRNEFNKRVLGTEN